MTEDERPVVFQCAGEILTGILHPSAMPSELGAVIVVGGPQYRVGSHRQFVQMGRDLADAGICAFRFDYRGMGDATGHSPGFSNCMLDISSAIEVIREEAPEIRKIVLWGLCDGASAIAMFGASDPLVAGMALVNPWVRSEEGLARAQVRTHYSRRVVSLDFWKRVFSGKVEIKRRLGEFGRVVKRALRVSAEHTQHRIQFQDRMAEGLRDFSGPVLLVLSGRDITAAEFEAYTGPRDSWISALSRCSLSICKVPEADHTFSSADSYRNLSDITIGWMSSL